MGTAVPPIYGCQRGEEEQGKQEAEHGIGFLSK